VIDGELVVLDDHGRPQFERLKARAAKRKPESVRAGAAADPDVLFVFDLLSLDGEDYRHFPLTVRKAILSRVLAGSKRVVCAEHINRVTGRAMGHV
jgi:ATP-dependent DNA ligase